MKKFKKLLLISLCLVLVVALTIAGTVAFLQDEDGEINVMTVGNVHIEQIEEQFDENGELEAFEQNKLLYPVPEVAHNNDTFLQAVTTLAPEVNVVDKIVTVKNTGKSEAYLRTVFAIEMGAVDVDTFLTSVVLNVNTANWTWTSVGKTYINGSYYYLVIAQYNVALASKATTNFSLGQVFLKASVGNEVCEAIDGNGNGTLDILTMSQAVQTVGFGNATAALTAAFGEVTTVNHPWASNKADHVVSTVEQLQAALAVGGKIRLTEDLTVDATLVVPAESVVILDLDGKIITGTQHKNDGAVIQNAGTLTIVGGVIDSTAENGGSAVLNETDAILTVKNSTLNGAPNAGGSWPSYTVNNKGTMVVESSTITSVHGAVASYGANAVVTLNNVNINMTGIAGMTSHALYSYNSGKIVVNNTSANTIANNAADQNSTGASVINGDVTVNGGNFVGRIENYYGNPILNAGTYSVNPAKKYVTGMVVDNGNGTWTVYPVTDTWDGTADISWYPTVATAAETNTNPVYYLYTAEQLAGLAELVNVHGVQFKNTTIKLMVDVDLDNKAWTPIGQGKTFEGADYAAGYATFDGNGKTISNLKVDVNAYAGLFGAAKFAAIKNVTVVNATVNSNHYAGVILAQGYAQVENCTVKNATVTATPELINGEWDNGDKAGGVVGQITEGSPFYVKNCIADSVTVTAYRDFGGILGYANDNVSVIGNSATNVTLVINKEHNYKNYTTDAEHDASIIVGDGKQSGVKVEDNKYNGTPIVTVGSGASINDALQGAGNTVAVVVGQGTYELPSSVAGKNVTIMGTKDTVINVNTAFGAGGANLTFDGVTIKGTNSDYQGIQHCGKIVYNNVTFNDATFLYGPSVTFNNCTFNLTSSYIWTYDAEVVNFNNCTFNTTGKAVLVYHENADKSHTVNFTDCSFNASAPAYTWDGQWVAAVEIDSSLCTNGTYTVCFYGENVADSNFNGLVRIKKSTGDNAVIKYPVAVNNAAALKDALASGKDVFLTGHIVADFAIEIPEGVVLNGNGKTITYGVADDYHLVRLYTNATLKNVTLNNYRVRTENTTAGTVTMENVVINMDHDLTGLDLSRGSGTAKLTNVVCKGTKDAAHLDPNTQVQVDYTPYGDVLLGGAWALEATECDFGSLHGWNTRNGSNVSLNNTTYTVFRMHYWSNRTLYVNGVVTAWADSGAIPVAHDVGGCWSVQPAFK